MEDDKLTLEQRRLREQHRAPAYARPGGDAHDPVADALTARSTPATPASPRRGAAAAAAPCGVVLGTAMQEIEPDSQGAATTSQGPRARKQG